MTNCAKDVRRFNTYNNIKAHDFICEGVEEVKKAVSHNNIQTEHYELKVENVPYCEKDGITKKDISLENIILQEKNLKVNENTSMFKLNKINILDTRKKTNNQKLKKRKQSEKKSSESIKSCLKVKENKLNTIHIDDKGNDLNKTG